MRSKESTNNSPEYALIKAAATEIIKSLEEKIPVDTIGFKVVEIGNIFLDTYKFLQNNYGRFLDRVKFENYMTLFLEKDKRVFLREPIKLPTKSDNMKAYKKYIYFNNLGMVTSEYADSYIESYVRKYFIELLSNGLRSYSYIPYIFDGKLMDGALFALQHFAGYDETQKGSMLDKLRASAQNYNASFEVIPEYELFARSDSDETLYFLVKLQNN